MIKDPLPYANGPRADGRGIKMLASGPDAPLSPRSRTIFYALVGAVVVAGIVLIAVMH